MHVPESPLNSIIEELSSPRATFSFAFEEVIVKDVAVAVDEYENLMKWY